MAHQAQQQFFNNVKEKYPGSFANVKVCDCGSLDVNGSLKGMFFNSDYTGVDIIKGANVDVVSKIHELEYKNEFDTVVSGEMLEHSEYYKEDLQKMVKMLKSGGLLAISAGGKGRPEHGTTRTGSQWGTSPDYYKNIVKKDFQPILKYFTKYKITYNPTAKDIYFWGIKK